MSRLLSVNLCRAGGRSSSDSGPEAQTVMIRFRAFLDSTMPQAHQLGRYLLLDRIAYGGMAEIYRAKTFDSEGRVHLVAVKRVLSHLVEDDDFLQMIVDEAKISALLRHENIAQLYEFAHAQDEYFLAMEYVDGKDLRNLIERMKQLGRKLSPAHAAWVAMETARALHAAHIQRDAQGEFLRIVHRDVSPSNVLLSYRGEVKLCDFGIAKATLTRIQTKTGVITGKVKYMSPEQAMGRKLDHRSDLFSLGTVLYEMLALTPPFGAATEVELIFAVRECRKRPLSDHRRDVPPQLAAILDRLMTRSRSARYQSGEDLSRDLRAFLDVHAPGYRRAHFAQFMRETFQQEIESELRQMEEYVLSEADATRVGENLIASALAPDAPFTKFTPFAKGGGSDTSTTARLGPVGTGEAGDPNEEVSFVGSGLIQLDPEDSALQAEPTRMIARPGLSEQPTVLKQPAPRGFHEEATRLHDMPDRTNPVPRFDDEDDQADSIGAGAGRSIHDEDTGKKLLPPVSDAEEDFVVSDDEHQALLLELEPELEPEIDAEDTSTAEREHAPHVAPLHNEQTRILNVDAALLDKLREVLSVAAEPTMIKSMSPAPGSRTAAGDSDEDEDEPLDDDPFGDHHESTSVEEETSVPLDDDDLEDLK